MIPTKARAAAEAIVAFDKAVSHRLAGHRDRPLAKAAGWAAEAADQPQLLSLCAATIAVGGFTGRRDLVRGGALAKGSGK